MPSKFEKQLDEKKDAAKKEVKIKSLKEKGLSERDAVIQSFKPAESPVDGENQPAGSAQDDALTPRILALNLENEDLDNLGITDLPAVGGRFTIDADVQSVSSSSDDAGIRRALGLRVTGLKPHKEAPKKDSPSTD